MKKIPFVIIIILLGAIQSSQAQRCTLTVEFHVQKKSSGMIYVSVYNRESGFLQHDMALTGVVAEPDPSGITTVVIESLPPGIYAVAGFLDENDNGKFDTNFLGIPKEKYGFSNDVRPLMRAATYKEASFNISSVKTISIHLK